VVLYFIGENPLKIRGLIWLDEIIDKLDRKHHVSQIEVLEVLSNRPYFRFIEKGHRPGEDVYAAMGQTKGGRYLILFFIYKKDGHAIILSARDMMPAERKRYEER
jgi:uncharacterized DUF497 family protein